MLNTTTANCVDCEESFTLDELYDDPWYHYTYRYINCEKERVEEKRIIEQKEAEKERTQDNENETGNAKDSEWYNGGTKSESYPKREGTEL